MACHTPRGPWQARCGPSQHPRPESCSRGVARRRASRRAPRRVHRAATHGLLADALLTTGDREAGHQLILDVWGSARRMGAGWFEREAERIARRHRISGSPTAPTCHGHWRCSPQESGRFSRSWPLGRLTARSPSDWSSPRKPRACTSATSWPSSGSPTVDRPRPSPASCSRQADVTRRREHRIYRASANGCANRSAPHSHCEGRSICVAGAGFEPATSGL